MKTTRGELAITEPHPSAYSALAYVRELGLAKLSLYQEAYSSCAIEGNRDAEICGETLTRVMTGQKVSDRYVLGLAWSIRNMEAKDQDAKKCNCKKEHKKKARKKKSTITLDKEWGNDWE